MKSPYLLNVLNNFNIPAASFDFLPVDHGRINQSYFVVCNQEPLYVLQQINISVFSNIDALINNFNYLSNLFLNKKQQTLTLISTKGDKYFFRNSQNNTWRLCPFIKNSISFQETFKKEIALEAGKLLGNFHCVCSQADMSELQDNVPEFHNTVRYYDALNYHINHSKQKIGLEVFDIINMISSREKDIYFFETLLNQGLINKKLVHNDTKLSNMLFDNNSLKGICLIDLDTADRGLLPYDFGDAVRSICKKQTGTNVLFDIDLFEEFVKGYFKKIERSVLGNDYNYLFKGVKIVTLELLIRYLTDFISKSCYFKLDNNEDALSKALMLQSLFLSIEKNELQAIDLIEQCVKG